MKIPTKSILRLTVLCLFMLAVFACASTESGTGLALMDAIEQSAEKITEDLPKGSRVAIVAFDSESDTFSDFIMEELTGALVDRGIEVADRRNLAYVYKELDFQMSGDASDETAQSIGKFLGAQLVITGELTNVGGSYRYRTSAINVEKATRDSVTRLYVRKDREIQNTIAALNSKTSTPVTAKYGVSENTVPQTIGTFIDRGILFASRGDYEMAIADFTDAIKLNPNLASAYILRGRAYFASVSKVISIGANFDGVESYSTLGSASAEQKRVFEKAIADFVQAIQLEPNNSRTYRERGRVYSDMGDSDKAIADYNHVIRLNPNSASAYKGRGIVYYSKKDYDKAIADYTQAIKLGSDSAYYARGLVYYDKEDYDKAIADYTQSIKLEPNYISGYIARGIAYNAKKDYDKAIADYTQAIKLDPNSLDPYLVLAYRNRGLTYYNKQDYDKAIADYTQAIKLDPNSVNAYINRGVAYQNGKKDYARAIADYEAALRLDPNHALAKQNLEKARKAQGQ